MSPSIVITNFKKIRIVYTQPKKYEKQSESNNFAIGVKEIFTMSEFVGARLPGYSSLLIMFLGYDIIRARGVYEHIQPHRVISIQTKESMRDMNIDEEQYSIDIEKKLQHSIFDIERINEELENIYTKNIEKMNISISLNGNKIHSIVALLFAKKHRDVQIFMSSPIDYYPDRFSIGGKETFEIIFNKSWINSFLNKNVF